MPIRSLYLSCILLPLGWLTLIAAGQDDVPSKQETAAALRKAVAFFSEEVSVEGGYLWRYSADLSKKEGEGKVGDTTAWLQPPGTPCIGEALLDLFELTGDAYYFTQAKQTAQALLKGQLHSGGWDHRIEFDPKDRERYAYRIDHPTPGKRRNLSTLDDNKTQSALRFLIRFDQTAKHKEEAVHEAVIYGLNKLIDARFPNGAWSHAFEGKPKAYPIKKADYRKEGEEYTRQKEYWKLYTLNDDLQSDVIDTLALAATTYGDEGYWNALKKAADFLVLAQMPEPQPGWCQQYDYDMHPAWARKFEPAAVSAGESQNVMMTLMDVYEITGEKKYLEPIPGALRYYRSCLLEDGGLARFYELRTNKPLYFTRDYELTYSDADMPTHYAFKITSKLDRIEERYQTLTQQAWRPPTKEDPAVPHPAPREVRRIMDAMDERGAWVEAGRMRYWGEDDPTDRIIHPRTFVKNALTLARYIHHLDSF